VDNTWPGRLANTFLFGKSTRNLIANDALWDFFRAASADCRRGVGAFSEPPGLSRGLGGRTG